MYELYNLILFVSVLVAVLILIVLLVKSHFRKLLLKNQQLEDKLKTSESELKRIKDHLNNQNNQLIQLKDQLSEGEKIIQKLEYELAENARQIDRLKNEIDEKVRENEKFKRELEEKNKKIEEYESIFNTLLSLLGADKAGIEEREEKKIKKLEKFLFDEFIQIIDDMNIISHEYKRFDALRESFLAWKLTKIRGWSDKKINIALIGKFSAGKSSIINSLLINQLLPVDVTPTTAIPTYLSYGFEDEIYFEDIEGNIKKINSEVFRNINYEVLKKFPISSFIKYFVVFCDLPFKDINMIDTPGISSLKDIDLEKMHEGLEIADVLFYIMDINDGTITEDVIAVLSEIHNKDIYLIVNKVDTKPPSEINKIATHIRELCMKRALHFKDILFYSAKKDKNGEYKDKLHRLIQKICNQCMPANRQVLFEQMDKLLSESFEILKSKRQELIHFEANYNKIEETEKQLKKLSELNEKLKTIRREVCL